MPSWRMRVVPLEALQSQVLGVICYGFGVVLSLFCLFVVVLLFCFCCCCFLVGIIVGWVVLQYFVYKNGEHVIMLMQELHFELARTS